MNIRDESLSEWKQAFANVYRQSQYDENFCELLAKRERASEAAAAKHLQPWLHILEDSIQWLANLAAILDRLNTDGALNNAERAIWAMVGASCSHAMAVRRLVISGLDTPARAEARTLDEHLSACIAFLHDRELAEQFHQCQTKDDAAQFWYKNLNTKALRKHLNAVERTVSLEPIVSADMRAWRSNEIDWFSQAIHPSYLGAALSTITLTAEDPDMHGPAFLGLASACSERTLDFACKSIWYFACFGFMMLFNEHNSHPPVIPVDKEDEMHQMAVVGRYVIQRLNRKYWSYEIYPSTEAQTDV
ncbi:MAG: hypothetical protein M0Q15_02030 [Nevskia sp.]|jgi:hypothetical protein|nr:hypothetical protein [Nevskia sp.]